jgi:hypothetical protein
MKTKSIILRGGYASGKTFLAETIAGVLEPSKVLKVNPHKTEVGMLRQILDIGGLQFDLIIFDGCFDELHIKSIDENIIQLLFQKYHITFKTVIYTTCTSLSFNDLKKFKLIECTFKLS